MKLVWQPQALEDLHSIRHYIAEDNPGAATRVVAAIATAVYDQLVAFPESGRPGRVEGTRELVISKTPFIVPYCVRDETVHVLGVHHAARRWPDQF